MSVCLASCTVMKEHFSEIYGSQERERDCSPINPGAQKTSAKTSHFLQGLSPRENEKGGYLCSTLLHGINESCNNLLYFQHLEGLSMRWHHPV